MSFNPIDIMRSQEATQIKQIEAQRSQYAQDQNERNFQNIVRQEQSKTTQTAKSDNKEYRYDAREKGNNQYKGSGSKNKNKKKDDKQDAKKQNSGGIDLLI